MYHAESKFENVKSDDVKAKFALSDPTPDELEIAEILEGLEFDESVQDSTPVITPTSDELTAEDMEYLIEYEAKQRTDAAETPAEPSGAMSVQESRARWLEQQASAKGRRSFLSSDQEEIRRYRSEEGRLPRNATRRAEYAMLVQESGNREVRSYIDLTEKTAAKKAAHLRTQRNESQKRRRAAAKSSPAT